MVLALVAFEAYRKKPFLGAFLWTLCSTYFLVILYGLGQKFLGFPAFLTMNEEFAKGVPLRLPPTARFPSTFGGHYDLAAYLVLTIPIMGSFMVGMKKYWQNALFLLLTILGLVSLLFTASRVSFGVYLIVMSVMLLWHKRAIFIVPMILFSLLVMNFTSGASERFYKTFRVSDVVVDLSTGKPIGTLDSVNKNNAVLEKGESPAEESLPKGSEYIGLAGGTDDQVKTVQLYKSQNVTGAGGEIATISGSFLIQKALVYDISITTRLQAEWPNAIKAFKRNLLLGSGYSTLSVATDGDYHRMLGETGIAGFVTFLGIFAVAFYLFIKRRSLLAPIELSFVIGVFAGVVGLLVNAVLIDVFEASKVAFTLWLYLGMATAILVAKKPFPLDYFQFLRGILTHRLMLLCYLFLATWIVWGKAYGLNFLGDDFTWLRWAAESSGKDILRYFTDSQGFFYRPVPKAWYYLLFSIFWLKPFAYHVLSVAIHTFVVYCMYTIIRYQTKSTAFAWFGALLFGVLSILHENIYWISGQSSLLASAFLMASIVCLLRREAYPKWAWLLNGLVYVLLLACMLSYDGMVVAPIIVCLISMLFFRTTRLSLSYLLLIPLYVWLRMSAGALAPSGDYGYKSSTFVLNATANTIGYAASALFGPGVVEWFGNVRMIMKSHVKEFAIGSVIVVFVLGIYAWIRRSRAQSHKTALVWLGCFVVALAAYSPLGGMAERYAYIPSIFLVLALVSLAYDMWTHTKGIWLKIAIAICYGAIIVYNVQQVARLGADWEKASSVVDQTLRVIKKEAFPPKNPKNFYIVNTPIRYGRAWIFPTGLTDALWHIYRQSPYAVTPVRSIEEGYSIYFKNGDREVFIFEDYVLKRGVQEIKSVKEIPIEKK